MTTVRIAHVEPRPGRLPGGGFRTRGWLVVLADDISRRAVPLWLAEPPAGDLARLAEVAARSAEEVTPSGAPQELAAGAERGTVSAEIPDADLVALARDGDPAAFRLLVERHQSMVRARARSLCGNPSDVDDVMQESFLQAFTALDRLHDPERFAGWLAAIVLNVSRAQYRWARPALLPDWPESLHPASADGPPSAEDLDRHDALRAAIAGLPAGQRRAVALHYYAGVPAGQLAGQPGTARVSLHKARNSLRAYLTEHRPDLIPVARRTNMTTVRVTRMESRIPLAELSGLSRGDAPFAQVDGGSCRVGL